MFQADPTFLQQVSPTLCSKHVDVLFIGKVFKVGHTNALNERIFIVATNAIYLVRKRNFSVKVVKMLSYFDLQSVHLAGNICSFSSQKEQIRIKTEDSESLAFLVYFIGQAQFPPSLHSISLYFPADRPYNIQQDKVPYKAQYILGDRITSCAAHFNIEFTSDEIEPFYQSQRLRNNLFIITPEVMHSKMFPAIALALAYEQDLINLQLKNVSVKHVLQNCASLFILNKYVRRIVFTNCEFTYSGATIAKLFKNYTFHPTEWCFIDCDVIGNEFASFFEALSEMGTRVLELEVGGKGFDHGSLTAVFQSIFFNECFHHLRSLSIDGAKGVDDLGYLIGSLAGCNWALTQKCVRRLQIANCGVEVADFMTRMLSLDIGLQELRLPGNAFTRPLNDHLGAVRRISFLDLSGCRATIKGLSSLVEAGTTGAIQLRGLGLSGLEITPQELTILMALLSVESSVFPYLERFNFDDNELGAEQTYHLASFVGRQPQLKRLSLSRTVAIRETSAGLEALFGALQGRGLEALFLGGDGSIAFSYGPLLTPLLKSLCSEDTLKILDVSEQRLGQEALDVIQKMRSLEELFFDGCNPPSVEYLIAMCHSLIGSGLKVCAFPHQTMSRLLSRPPSYADPAALSELAARTLEKFVLHFGALDSSLRERGRRRSSMAAGNDSTPLLLTEKKDVVSDESIECPLELIERAPGVREPFEECVGDTQIADAVRALLGRLEEKVSTSALSLDC